MNHSVVNTAATYKCACDMMIANLDQQQIRETLQIKKSERDKWRRL
jgi:hypothetical protein